MIADKAEVKRHRVIVNNVEAIKRRTDVRNKLHRVGSALLPDGEGLVAWLALARSHIAPWSTFTIFGSGHNAIATY